MDIRSTDKPNSTSAGDWGELNATAEPTDSAAPPTSDSDSYPDEPGTTTMVGPH